MSKSRTNSALRDFDCIAGSWPAGHGQHAGCIYSRYIHAGKEWQEGYRSLVVWGFARRIDMVVKDPQGVPHILEVKSGNAVKSSALVLKDSVIAQQGGKWIGKNSGAVIDEFGAQLKPCVMEMEHVP